MKEITLVLQVEAYTRVLDAFNSKFGKKLATEKEKHLFMLSKLQEYMQRIVTESEEQVALQKIRSKQRPPIFTEKTV